MEQKQEACVAVNVYVKCDKCEREKCESYHTYPDKDKKSCVDVNVYVECDNKEKK